MTNDPVVTQSILESTLDRMLDRKLTQAFEKFADIVSKRVIDEVTEIINVFVEHIDERFNKVEADIAELKQRVTSLEDRMTKLEMAVANLQYGITHVEENLPDLNRKYDHIVTTLDSFLKRLDETETDSLARDRLIARIEHWIDQLAKQSNLTLER